MTKLTIEELYNIYTDDFYTFYTDYNSYSLELPENYAVDILIDAMDKIDIKNMNYRVNYNISQKRLQMLDAQLLYKYFEDCSLPELVLSRINALILKLVNNKVETPVIVANLFQLKSTVKNILSREL